MSRFGLGKGLGALIPEHQQYFEQGRNPDEPGVEVVIVPLTRIKPNPDQPRKSFPEGSIDELADSIRRHGLLQPILVEPAGDGTYIIVAGERRYRAASRAGLSEVPAIVRPLSNQKRLEISLIENIQREDLNPLEEARAYQNLMELTGTTQEQVAEAVGKNRSTVANALRLLRLSEPMQAALRDGLISSGHARSLLAVADEGARQMLFRRIIQEGMSVRQTEKAVQELSSKRNLLKPAAAKLNTKEKSQLEPNLAALRERFIERFGTKVDIKGTMDKGSILIEYYTSGDLQRILDAVDSGA